MLHFAMFILLTISSVSASIFPGEFYRQESPAQCVLKVMKQLTNGRKSLDMTLVNVDQDLAVDLHKADGIRFVTRTLLRNNLMPIEAYLIQFANYKELKQGMYIVRKDIFWSPRKEFIIIIEDISALQEVSLFLYTHNIFNVTVIGKKDNIYCVYGFNPLVDTCNRPTTKVLENISKCSEYTNQKTFRHYKTNKLRDCRIKLGTRPGRWPPEINQYQDVELYHYILQEWFQFYNISIDIVELHKEATNNTNRFQLIKQMQHYRLDGLLGFSYQLVEGVKTFDFTYPYNLEKNNLVVGRAKLLTTSSAMYGQLKVLYVLTFILFVIFAVGARYLAIFRSRREDWFRDFIIVAGYLFQNFSTRETSREISSRLFIYLLIYYALFFNTIYVGQLSSVLTRPMREHQIDDQVEVFSKFKPAYDTNYIDEMRENLLANGKHMPLEYELCNSTIDCMEKVAAQQRLYTFVTYSYYNFNIWRIKSQCSEAPLYRIKTIHNNIYETLLFYPGSTITEPFSKLVHRIHIGGFAIRYYRLKLHRDRLKSKCKDKPKRMVTLRYVFHACLPVFAMVGFSMICFFCEIIYFNVVSRRI